jgi:predicted nucleic acid-binding protein
MYLTGADHLNKHQVLKRLPALLLAHEELVTSVETFQEILHRFKAIHDPKNLNFCYSAAEEMVEQCIPVLKVDVDSAKTFAIEYRKLSARDCLHVAVMKRIACKTIWTFDRGFEQVPFVSRIE